MGSLRLGLRSPSRSTGILVAVVSKQTRERNNEQGRHQRKAEGIQDGHRPLPIDEMRTQMRDRRGSVAAEGYCPTVAPDQGEKGRHAQPEGERTDVVDQMDVVRREVRGQLIEEGPRTKHGPRSRHQIRHSRDDERDLNERPLPVHPFPYLSPRWPRPYTRNVQSILTPDQRLRVYISASEGLDAERKAVAGAIEDVRLIPVTTELGARPYAAHELYRSYLEQSQIFIGIYGTSYGVGAPGAPISILEEEYLLSEDLPRLIYVKLVPEREERLDALLAQIRQGTQSYKLFNDADELAQLVSDDLALLLTESFAGATETETPAAEESAPAIPGPNLPTQMTALVGRERDVAEIESLLRRDDVRLVTLTGPGGIGKTRLAFEVLERTRSSFVDGVQYALLAPLHDPNLVPAAIGQVLAIREAPDRSTLDVIKELLRDREVLLVLDNFEHVLEAAPMLAELLAAAPRLKLLVTSRSALQLLGEQEYAVRPLAVPTDPHMTKEHLSGYGAVSLFVDRASAANRAFELNEANAQDVVEIVTQLDGLPLAIELAAARARSLPPRLLLERIQSRLDLLSRGPRDLPERQQTLRALLDWDYELLQDEERNAFRRLSVFARGFSLEAATRVGFPDQDELDALELIESLLRKSLIAQADVIHGVARFAMLNTLREYASEKLEEAGEAAEARRRHAFYFTELAEDASARLRDPDQVRWLDTLEVERDNMRVALSWADSLKEAETELRLAGALASFWESRGYLTEGQRWLERALSNAGADADPFLKARALDGAGILARSQGELKRSRTLLEESVALRRQLGDKALLANSLRNLGNALFDIGDLDKTADLYEESLGAYRDADDDAGMAAILNNLGVLASYQENWQRAQTLYEESLELYRAREDTQGIARSLMNLGDVKVEQGDYVTAAAHLHDSFVLFQELRSRWDIAYLLEGMANVMRAREFLEDAAKLLGSAEPLREVLGAPLPPSELQPHRRLVDKIQAGLDPSVFNDAWAKGRAMDMDEAVTYALSLR